MSDAVTPLEDQSIEQVNQPDADAQLETTSSSEVDAVGDFSS